MEPDLRQEGKYTVIREIPVCLAFGIVGRPSAQIKRESEKFPGEIILSNSEGTTSGRDLVGVLSLGAYRDSKINLLVENVLGVDSEKVARRFYAGLTSYGGVMEFDRTVLA